MTPGFSISVVIPTWNGLHLLRENLPSVLTAVEFYRARSGAAVEILVVDDGSTDTTVQDLPDEFPQVKLIIRPRNGGFAKACNTGFDASRHSLVALLNNDVDLDPEYLLHMASHFEEEDVFAVTAKVYEWDSTTFTTGGRYGRFRRGFWSVYFNYDVQCDAAAWIDGRKLFSAYAIGGFATYHREKLQRLDGFNELLSPFHWEDVDLSYRGWKRGWKIHYEPRSTARHRTSATIDAHYRKKHVDAVSFRNRLLFHWINLHSPSFLIRHLLMLLVLTATRVVALDFYFYRSLYEAILKLPEVLSYRAAERKALRRSDTEVARMLTGFYGAAPIEVYFSQREVLERHPEAQ